MGKKIATTIDMLGNKITGLAMASAASDAVRYDQLAGLGLPTAEAEAIQLNIEVKAVSTSNITLSGTQNVGGVALAANDYCLVAGQTNATQNGVYKVSASSWTRATGHNTDTEIRKRFVLVYTDGTASRTGDVYICVNRSAITIGTTAIYFSRLPVAIGAVITSLLYKQGILVSGNIIDAGLSTLGLQFDAPTGRGAIVSGRTGVSAAPLDVVASEFNIYAKTMVEVATTFANALMLGSNTRIYAVANDIVRFASASNNRGFEVYASEFDTRPQLISYDRNSSNYNELMFDIAGLLPARSGGAIPIGSSIWRWGTIYTTTAVDVGSDRRIKHDIEHVPVGLDFINDLHPVQYKLNKNGVEVVPLEEGEEPDARGITTKSVPTVGKRFHYGLIAQELKEVLDKHGVDGGVWCTDDKSNPDALQSIRYEELIAPMIRAMQEMSAQIDKLTKRVNGLEIKL